MVLHEASYHNDSNPISANLIKEQKVYGRREGREERRGEEGRGRGHKEDTCLVDA